MNDRDTTKAMPTTPAAGQPYGAPPSSRRGRLSRRGLLIGAGAVGLGAVAITSGLLYAKGDLHLGGGTPPTPAADAQIQHLVRRAGFGARSSEIAEYSALGYSGAVDRLLNFASVADDLDQRLQSLNLDLTRPQDQQRWWLLRMIYSKRPFEEKMTLFWHGLLTSSFQKVGGKRGYPYIIQQNQFLRAHALDTYDNILLGITQDPAMMWWLDLRLNKKQAPNENYARELMELFTLGVTGGYTQDDVHNGALALTGFKLSANGVVTYNASQHDDSQKTYLGHSGNLDYHDVIRIVAAHPATGPFLCTRLFRFFVHENPSDADIKTLADVYYSSGHSINAVMKTLFMLPTFLSADAYRARLKSPTEYTLGTIRQMEVELDGQGISTIMALMGQVIFAPPNVAGWPGDQSSAEWMNTGTWLIRVNFINALLNGSRAAKGGGGVPGLPSANALLQTAITSHNLHTPDEVLSYFVNLLVDGQMANDRQQVLRTYLTDSNGGSDTLKLVGGQSLSANNLRGMLYLLMASPEYQLN